MDGIPQVVVAGHICLDVIPEVELHGHSLDKLLLPGKLVKVGPAVLSTGGAVSNTGIGMGDAPRIYGLQNAKLLMTE